MITVSDDFKTRLEAGLIMPRIYITKDVHSSPDIDYDSLISASVSYGIGDGDGYVLGGDYSSGLKAEVVADTNAIRDFLAHYETAAAANYYNAEMHARYITYITSDLTHYPVIGGSHKLYRSDFRSKVAQVSGKCNREKASADMVIDPSIMGSTSNWRFPMPIQDCITRIVRYGFGRTAYLSNMQFNINLPVDPLTNDSNLTYRDALKFLMAAAGGYMDDKFHFRHTYLMPNTNNTHLYDQEPMSGRIISAKTSASVLYGKGVRLTAYNGAVSEDISSSAGTNGTYMLYVKDKNPFFSTASQLDAFTRLVDIYTYIGNMYQTNAELEIVFDPRIEPGDWIRYKDEYGNLRYSYITQITYTANGIMKLSSRLADYEEA